MKLLLCLRRALAGLRPGVGGSRLSFDIETCIRPFIQQLSKVVSFCGCHVQCKRAIPSGQYAGDHKFSVLRATYQYRECHVASLPVRSSKRYGPLVLGFTGGKT
jgi:hypothetical protein